MGPLIGHESMVSGGGNRGKDRAGIDAGVVVLDPPVPGDAELQIAARVARVASGADDVEVSGGDGRDIDHRIQGEDITDPKIVLWSKNWSGLTGALSPIMNAPEASRSTPRPGLFAETLAALPKPA